MSSLSKLLGTPEERAWMEKGRCRGMDPAIFYPDEEQKNWAVRVAEAQKICAECPVIDECLEWALTRNEGDGVWGGASERERRKIKRQRAREKRKQQATS